MLNVPYVSQPSTDDFGLTFSKLMYDTKLAASTEQTLTVPSQAPRYKAVFKFNGGDVWVANNATATVAGASFAPTNSELNPLCREVKAGDVLHFITLDANTEVSVVFYAVGSNT